MQGVAISKIPGALVIEIEIKKETSDRMMLDNYYARGYNECREEMSQVKIGLKREELAKLLFNTWFACGHFKDEKWKDTKEDDKESWRIDADAILQALPDLLTVVKEGM